jgi:hypothetical protein
VSLPGDPCPGSVSGTYNITVNPTPALAPFYSPDPLCSGVDYTLNSGVGSCPGCTFLWTSAASPPVSYADEDPLPLPGITVTAVTTLTYGISVTNSFGCNATGALPVTIIPYPVAGIISGATVTCGGDVVDYTVTGNNGPGTWSIGVDPSIATIDPLTGILTCADVPCTEYVPISFMVKNDCNPPAYASYGLTINPKPKAWVTYDGCLPACPGSTVTFHIFGTEGSYVTYHILPYGMPPVDYAVTMPSGPPCTITEYDVTVTATAPSLTFVLDAAQDLSNYCERLINQEITIDVGNPTAVLIAPSPQCPGIPVSYTITEGPSSGVVVIEPVGGGTPLYIYLDPLGSGTSATITPLGPVTYQIVSVWGCCVFALIGPPVTYTPLSVPLAGTIYGPTVACGGDIVHYTVTGNTGPGTWSIGVDPSIATIDPAAGVLTCADLPCAAYVPISFMVDNLCGPVYASYGVTINPKPTASVTYDGCLPACPGTPVTFHVFGTEGSYVTYHILPYGMPPVDYAITMPSGPPCTISEYDVTVTPAAPSLTFVLDAAQDLGTGCTRLINQEINVSVVAPTASLIAPQQAECPGVCVYYTVTGPPNGVVVIEPVGGGTPMYIYLDPIGAGTSGPICPMGPVSYQIVSIWGACCIYTALGPAVAYTPLPAPVMTLSATPNPVCEGGTFTLTCNLK